MMAATAQPLCRRVTFPVKDRRHEGSKREEVTAHSMIQPIVVDIFRLRVAWCISRVLQI